MSLDPKPSNLRWPEPETKLFGIAGDLIAATPSSGKEWGRFADAYILAAEAVVKSLQLEDTHGKDPQTKIDYLVYPIFYLYRHFLELRLKEVILIGQKLTSDKTHWDMNHDLMTLWAKTRRILVKVFPNDRVEDLENAQRLIESIHLVDSRSFAFRYPTEKNSETQHSYGQEKLSIQQFSEGMTRLALFLGAASFAINLYLERAIETAGEANI